MAYDKTFIHFELEKIENGRERLDTAMETIDEVQKSLHKIATESKVESVKVAINSLSFRLTSAFHDTEAGAKCIADGTEEKFNDRREVAPPTA